MILLALFTDVFQAPISKEGIVQTVTVEVVENKTQATEDFLVGRAILFGKPVTVGVQFSKTANTFGAGDKLMVEAGVYTEKSSWRKSSGVQYRLYPKGDVALVGQSPNSLRHLPYRLRQWVFQNLQSLYGTSTQGALLSAMITGNKDGLSPQQINTFSKSGISHIMAVSGLHMSILLGFCTLVLGKRGGIYIGLPLLLVYGAISGFSPSTVRAIIMVAFASLTFLIRREYDVLTAFAVALFAELLLNPYVFYSMSFVLSFLSVLGIITILPKAMQHIAVWTKGHKKPYIKYVLSSIALSFSASVFTTPVVSYTFDRVSLISVVCNLFAVPLATLGLLLGMISVVLCSIIPAVAHLLASWVVTPILSGVLWLANTFTALPWSSLMGGVWYVTVFFTVAAVALVCWVLWGRGKVIFPLLACGLALCIGAQWIENTRYASVTIQMASDMPVAYIHSGQVSMALGAGEGQKNYSGQSFFRRQQFRHETVFIDAVLLGKMNKGNVTGVLSLQEEVAVKKVYGGIYQRELYGLEYEQYPQQFMVGDIAVTTYPLKYSEAVFLLEIGQERLLWCPAVAPKRLAALLAQQEIDYTIAVLSGQQLLDEACFSKITAPKIIVADSKAADWLELDGLVQLADTGTVTLHLKR